MKPKPLPARILRAVAWVLPGLDDAWCDAIEAELAHIPTPRERLSYTTSSLRGLVAIALSRHLRCYHDHARALIAVAALGILIATVDLHSDSRWPLRLAVPVTCAVAGWIAPRVAGVCGALTALALPLVIMLSGYHGPYEVDRGDAWLPFVPAVAIAVGAGWLRSRLTSRSV